MSKDLIIPDDNLIQKLKRKLNEQQGREQAADCPWHHSYRICIVTPVFGGGKKPGQADKEQPVRSASVRGHLRFWWRATRGAACENALELRKREVMVFGDTQTPSPFKIWVEQQASPSHPENDCRSIWNSGDCRYVLFPFDRNKQTACVEVHDFMLHIYYDKTLHEDARKCVNREIRAALWAWINFGGIGARTRRGCGSLYSAHFSYPITPSGQPLKPNAEQAESVRFHTWLQQWMDHFALKLPEGTSVREWPTLHRIVVRNRQESIRYAWEKTIRAYRQFRRRANRKSSDTGNSTGRSHWPEANAIRRITGMAEPKHKPPSTTDGQVRHAFPRAQFGLPINFHFKSGNGNGKNNTHACDMAREPFDTQLVPKGKNRLASRVLLKAIACSRQQGIGAIIILDQPEITALQLKPSSNESNQVFAKRLKNHEIHQAEVYSCSNDNRNRPIPGIKDPNPMKHYTSAIDALLNSEEVKEWLQPGKRSTNRYQERNHYPKH